MQRVRITLCVVLQIVLLSTPVAAGEVTHRPGAYTSDVPARASLRFVENVGQFGAGARFQVQMSGATLWLAEDALWLSVPQQTGGPVPPDDGDTPRDAQAPGTRGVHLKFSFAGANPHPRLEPLSRLDAHMSYFLGNDPARWHGDVPVWAGVRYAGLYPGVDLELSGRDGQWQQRFRLQPGADASALNAVRLQVDGAAAITLDGDHLTLATAAGEIQWPLFESDGAPHTPQLTGSEITAPFTTGTSSPRLSTSNRDRAPSADPGQLLYSTYMGGTNEDAGWGITRDAAGSLYLTGLTGSITFPTTPGAYQTTLQDLDAFVAKFDPSGTTLIYSTLLGGSDAEGGRAIEVDATGAAYIAGYSASPDFPTTPGAFQRTFAGVQDMVVTKLNAGGTALVYSTYVGGMGDDSGRDLLVAPGGIAVIAGLTQSAGFPVTAGALQPAYHGLTDGVIVKLDTTGSALTYSTFLGGSDYDEMREIAQDGQGTLYVTGRTHSVDYPVTAGGFQTVEGGDTDAFLSRLDAAGGALLYSTFIGGSGYDFGRGVAVDPAGAAYVIGVTLSPDFPTTPGALQPNYAGHQDVFVTKVNPAGSALVYSTYLGGGGDEAGRSILVDPAGAAYICGWTTSPGFPTTPGAYQQVHGGSGDAFVSKLDAAGSVLEYSTFFGGTDDEGAYAGILLDAAGHMIFSGYTASPDLPTTPDALQPAFGGGTADAFLTKLVNPTVPLPFRTSLPLMLHNAP